MNNRSDKSVAEEIRLLNEQLRSGSFELTEADLAERQQLENAAKAAAADAAEAVAKAEFSPEKREIDQLESDLESAQETLDGLNREVRLLRDWMDKQREQLSAAQARYSLSLHDVARLSAEVDKANSAVEQFPRLNAIRKRQDAVRRLADLMGMGYAEGYLTFGSYEQGRGKAPIEWEIIDVRSDRMLLISRYALDVRRYSSESAHVTWETSELRRWLNEDFFRTAFTEEEQKRLPPTVLDNYDNPRYGTDGGNPTKDRVFLLTIQGAEQYFSCDKDRICYPTLYARSHGASVDNRGRCWWWLRTPGHVHSHVASISYEGGVFTRGGIGNHDSNAVRPALWLYFPD